MAREKLPRIVALLALLTLGGVFAFIHPVDVLAQSADALTDVGDATGLGSEDPRLIVAKIIRTGLTLIGVLAVLLVLYAGFTWMTAGGNQEKIERAKKVLVRAGIGLAIILMSWAITTFIITALVNATGAGGNGGSGGSGGGSGLGGGSTSSFAVTDYSPDGPVSIRNVQLRVTFSRTLDEATVDGNIVITNEATGATVDGTIVVSGNYATFTPAATCPSPNEDRYCFDADTEFSVEVSDSIESATGTVLVCSSDRCVSSFATGSLVDTADPEATITVPDSGDGIPTDSTQVVQVAATDDSEVSSGEFLLDAVAFDSVGAEGDDLSSVTIETLLDTADLDNGTKYRISVTVTDIAGNTTDESVSVTARPAWCYNGVLDEDLGETAIDCGGDATSADYCGACDGGACTEDSQCASGSCVEGVCTTLPEISGVSPESGAVGTYVTVSGTGFGSITGSIVFTAADGATVEAEIPSCSDGWSSTEIVVEVPEGAIDGPITLTTNDGDSDATDDEEGALIDDFDVNEVVHPKLCSLTPRSAASTDAVNITGFDYGDERGESTVYFGDAEAGSYTGWADTAAAVTVPSLSDDDYAVVMTVDGVESNALSLQVLEDSSEVPTITGIDPESGAIGEYITISGANFGGSTGTVWFASEESGLLALASTDFPDACDEDYWDDDSITVIVPDAFQNEDDVTAGAYTVYVTTAEGADSATEDFTIEAGEPGPGICRLSPSTAEAGDTVVIYGERLGGTEGTVTFYDGVAETVATGGIAATVATGGWSSDEITVTVPTGVVTGPVSVTSAEGEVSNALNFAVGTLSTAGGEDIEAASYGWYFTTGDIPATPELLVECTATTVSGVPNAQFTDAVCTNAVVYGEFSILMDRGSVADAVSIVECTAGGDRPCSTTSIVEGELTVADSATSTYFTFVPNATWTTGTTYQVTVAETATSTEDVAIAADVSWTFETATTDAACAVSAVYVSPVSATIDTQGSTTSYHALPVSGCVVTDAEDYTWDWTVDNSYADFTLSSDRTNPCDGGTTSCATVVGYAEGEGLITAEETDSAIEGDGELLVNFTDPYVNNYAPNCEEACRDAAVYATFNTAMASSTILEGGAALYACTNELCTNLTEVDEYTVECVSDTADTTRCVRVNFTLGENLDQNAYYRVIISGDVTSVSEVLLTRTNYQGDFSWTFKVKDGESVCAVSRLTVTPDAAEATVIGQRQSFSAQAFGEPDSCSVAGQELTSLGYDWEWADPIADDGTDPLITVAEWWDATGSIDTNIYGRAAGCTALCTAGGSEPYAAICGDGIVGPGEECEDGDTIDGTNGCSSRCVHEGSDAATFACTVSGTTCTATTDTSCAETCVAGACSISGTACTLNSDCAYAESTCSLATNGCGDGVVATGEDCDDRNTRNGDGCSSICLNEGSQEVGATCGNGDVAYDATIGGEDCDDGNLDRGDGCDALCLNEGAPTSSSIGDAICGNGVIDTPYENCDTGLVTQGCSDSCLLEGSSALYTVVGTEGPSECGDSIIGTGEECDLGDDEKGDGCSSDCLLEGSSTAYTVASFCGDGDDGTGEWDLCESTGGDDHVDETQLSLISAYAAQEVDLDAREAVASIVVREPLSGLEATGTYTLSCTAATDLDCPDEATYGVGVANCCMLRPAVDLVPTHGETGVCRNAMIYGVFTEEMSVESFTVTNDGTITPLMYAKLDLTTVDGGLCPGTHTTLAIEPRGLFKRAWLGLRRVFTGIPASADTGDCVLPIAGYEQSADTAVDADGNLVATGTYTVRMRYSAAMEPDADYTLVINTDPNNTDGDAVGVLSAQGVGIFTSFGDNKQEVTFTTGPDICTLDAVVVEDTDASSPNYFSQTNEEHVFTAAAYSYSTGAAVEIQSIPTVYAWDYATSATVDAWDEDSEGAIIDASPSATVPAEATVTAVGDNGSANVIATATITDDIIGGTEGDTVSGTARVTAYLCENPWPELAAFPWEDTDMNFATFYCRDAGVDDDLTDDYEEVTVVQPPARAITNDVVLREYLFEVQQSTDAIGVRIVSNDDYLSPAAWYAAQGFTGSPQSTTVDGFDAVVDGRTTYIAAPNDAGAGVYSNIYVVSYNEGAGEETISIYEQIVANMTFATNLDDTGLCFATSTSTANETDGAGGTIACVDDTSCTLGTCGSSGLCEITTSSSAATGTACTSDLDCDLNASQYCGDEKGKLQRDTKRLADLTTIAAAVESYGDENGICSATVDQSCETTSDCPTGETCEAVVPTLASGTYVRSLGASAWTSWGDVLNASLELDASAVDPLNAYNGCGAGTLTSYDATTCVDAANGNYVCPDDSHVYHYRAVGAQAIQLAADLEYTGGAWVNTLDDDTTDAVTYYAASSGADAAIAGFTTDYFCETDSVFGSAGTCGDGVINAHSDGTIESCEIGERGGTALACDSDGDEVDDGTQEQACNSTCTGWTTDTDAECVPASCGNSVVDTGEDCDDGDYNGRYGYCGADCLDTSRYYCGDGELSGSEVCDCGAAGGTSPSGARPYGGSTAVCAGANGTYSTNPLLTCAWDCQGPANYCGDETVDEDEGEVCDEDTVSWSGKLCLTDGSSSFGVSTYAECTSDADCPAGNECTGSECPISTVCVEGDIGAVCDDDADCDTSSGSGDGVCSTQVYETTRTADCLNDGSNGETCTVSATWLTTDCRAIGSCGDGTVDLGEACDDGNTTNTDACTNECLANVCGDGFVYAGEEQCDEGAVNGDGCSSSYGSSCTACSVSCTYEVSSGDFCGDGVINGDEYCDAYDIPYAWYDDTFGVLEECDDSYYLQSYYSVYGSGYSYDSRTLYPICTRAGICNGNTDNGDACNEDGDCSSNDCVFPTCADSCTSSCPFVYDDTSLLLTSNQPGARSSSSVDLYTYSASSTSDIPNAATITIPACDAVSSITADISMDNVTPPRTFVLFVTDLSGSMDWEIGDSTPPESGEDSRLEIVQDGLETAIGDLYDELGSNVQIGAVGYKGMLANECYISGASCSTGCTTYSGDVCTSTTAWTENFPFTSSSDQDDIAAEVAGYFADNASNGTVTYEGLVAAKAMMDTELANYGTENTRYVIILLTDGDYSTTNPSATATSIKNAGYELYTATIMTDTTTAGRALISTAAGWSSGNPDTETNIDYAYDAQTTGELSTMFDEIISSILDIGITIISDDDSDSDTDAESDSATARDGANVELPWPTGFACDPDNEQELPVRFTFQGSGQIEISNVQIDYCAP